MKGARLFLLGLAASCISCPGMGQVLRLYGYHELKTPSTLFAPGTMVWVKSTQPFSAGVICTQDMSLGDTFKPMSSPTASSEMSQAIDKDFSFDADYMKTLKADARFHDISSIKVKLDKPMIYELTDVDVIRFSQERSPLCARAVEQRHLAGYAVSMIASALKADVTYSISWKTETHLSASDKVATLENLAMELGAERSNISEQTISAKDLYWGIRDDVYLAHLSDPTNVQPVVGHNRAISAGSAPTISRVPDIGETK